MAADTLRPIARALLSVSDKSGRVPVAQALAGRGIELLSTGGTAKALAEAGLKVAEVEDVTGFPEMLDGRVKTLHPAIHGGLLALRDRPEHEAALARHGIRPIDLLAVNLYPFVATVARSAPYEECVENIDIGGPALIRAAAKNHQDVTVVMEPDDYGAVLEGMERTNGAASLGLRRPLAGPPHSRPAPHDPAIAAPPAPH